MKEEVEEEVLRLALELGRMVSQKGQATVLTGFSRHMRITYKYERRKQQQIMEIQLPLVNYSIKLNCRHLTRERYTSEKEDDEEEEMEKQVNEAEGDDE